MKGNMGLGSKRSLASEKENLKELVANISEAKYIVDTSRQRCSGTVFNMGKTPCSEKNFKLEV